MTRITFIVMLVLILFSFSCNNSTNSDLIGRSLFKTIKFQPQGETKLFIEDIADTSFFRVLSTDQDFLLSYVNKIFFADSLIIFPQETEGLIYLYDMEGKPVRKIDAIGRGAGKATRITDVWYNKESQLIDIYDSSLFKIFSYDLKGKLVNEIKINNPEPGSLELQFVRSGGLSVFERLKAGFDNNMRLGIYNADMEFQSSTLPIPERLKNVNLLRNHVFEVYKDSIFYLPLLQNCIFTIDDTGASTAFEFEIPKDNRATEEYLNGSVFRGFDDYHADIGNSGYIHDFDMLYLTDKYISFNYTINKGIENRPLRNNIYVSKETGNTLQFSHLLSKKLPNIELPDVVVRGTMDDYFVVIVRPTQNIYLPKDILKELDENSNPVLMFFKLKDF